MINGQSVLAIIPARGGSKGIKKKNIYPLCGKPLIAYSILAGKESQYIDEVLISTDSSEIADVATQWGGDVPFMRPDYLAEDRTKTIDVIVHALEWLKGRGTNYDILVLLQPTQPLRTSADIDRALEIFDSSCAESRSLVSVSEVRDHPILIRKMRGDGKLENLLTDSSTIRRQDMQKYYRVNGCIYINDISEINKGTSFNDNNIPYVMPVERSVDIDEPIDLCIAEYYLRKKEM